MYNTDYIFAFTMDLLFYKELFTYFFLSINTQIYVKMYGEQDIRIIHFHWISIENIQISLIKGFMTLRTHLIH